MFAITGLDHSYFEIRIDKSLLINSPHALDVSDVIGVLTAQITRMFGFDFSVRLFFSRAFSKAHSWSSVRMTPSCATFADKALSRLANVSN